MPALPSGMEKEEEGEKHLQDILAVGLVDTGIVIPTPECSEIQTNPLSAPRPDKHQSSEKSDGAISNHYDRVRVHPLIISFYWAFSLISKPALNIVYILDVWYE